LGNAVGEACGNGVPYEYGQIVLNVVFVHAGAFPIGCVVSSKQGRNVVMGGCWQQAGNARLPTTTLTATMIFFPSHFKCSVSYIEVQSSPVHPVKAQLGGKKTSWAIFLVSSVSLRRWRQACGAAFSWDWQPTYAAIQNLADFFRLFSISVFFCWGSMPTLHPISCLVFSQCRTVV
jgi:hypothetical protein